MVLSKMSLFDVLGLNYLLLSRFGICRCMVLAPDMEYMRMRQKSFCMQGRCETIVVFLDTYFQARVLYTGYPECSQRIQLHLRWL